MVVVVHRSDSQLRRPEDGEEDQRIPPAAYSSPVRHARSFSVLLMLAVRFFACRSNDSPPPIRPVLHDAPEFLRGCLPTTL